MSRNLPKGPMSMKQILKLDTYECPRCTGKLTDMFITIQWVRLRCRDCGWTTTRDVKKPQQDWGQ